MSQARETRAALRQTGFPFRVAARPARRLGHHLLVTLLLLPAIVSTAVAFPGFGVPHFPSPKPTLFPKGPIGCGDDRLGLVVFVGGAGGGGIDSSAKDVLAGLRNTGYRGRFMEFVWQTGFGPLIDQISSAEDKREKSAKLALQLVAFRRANPRSPIRLIGYSAGTAVAVHALEQLPADVQVDGAVFMVSAMSADYDLGPALSRLRGVVDVFTSSRDLVLKLIAPVTGSADRRNCGQRLAGIIGFEAPAGAGFAEGTNYAKVHVLAWNSEFEKVGNGGGHTDFVGRLFVERVVTPRLLR